LTNTSPHCLPVGFFSTIGRVVRGQLSIRADGVDLRRPSAKSFVSEEPFQRDASLRGVQSSPQIPDLRNTFENVVDAEVLDANPALDFLPRDGRRYRRLGFGTNRID